MGSGGSIRLDARCPQVTVTIIVAVLIAGATAGVLLFLARGRMEGEEEESTE